MSASRSPGAVVAHFREAFPVATERFLYDLITHHRRYRPIVLTAQPRHVPEMPFPAIASPPPRGRALPAWALDRLGRALGREPFFGRRCRRLGVSLLHAHFGPDGVRMLRLANQLRVPLATSFYGYDTAQSWAERYRHLFAEGAAFLVEGPAMGRRLARLGCPPERIRVIPLGVADPPAEARHTPREAAVYRLLFVGRFVEKKGLEHLLAALPLAQRRTSAQLRLEVIGDAVGPDAPDYRARARELGIAEQITFHGMLPYTELLPWLSRCDLIVQPSVTARDGDVEGGAPTVLTLALAAGLPAVATRHCDIPEIVRDGETGLLCEEGDEPGLAAAIAALLADLPRREALARAARARFIAHFSLEAQVRATEALYDRLRA